MSDLWSYFSDKELSCQCGKCEPNTAYKMNRDFMKLLIALREKVAMPLPLSSAYRCSQHNQAVSSTGAFGPHTTGRAVDIKIRGADAYKVLRAAVNLGFTGIGFKQKGDGRFIHLDNLTAADHFPRPTVWSY